MYNTLLIFIGAAFFLAGLVYLILFFAGKIPSVNRYFLIAGIIGLIAGIFLVFDEADTGNYYNSVRHWPRIDATIIKSEIEGNRAVLPEIKYRYEVDSVVYKGTSNLGTPGFGGRNKRTLTAQTIIADYPEGSLITIAYNPDQPDISTTQFHPPWNYYGKIGLGLFLVLCSGLILLFYLPGKQK